MSEKKPVYRCKRCGKPIWVEESIMRGMGPICFGKSYAIRRMLKNGKTKEEIEQVPKQTLLDLAKEEVKAYKKSKNKKTQKRKVRFKKSKIVKDKSQMSIISFIEPKQEEDEDIEALREELNKITQSLSKTFGSRQSSASDRALKLMEKINKLEGRK